MGVAIDRQQEMERRDFDYYEARARDVILADITSNEDNAEILQRLRRQDTSLKTLNISEHNYYDDNDEGNNWFIVGEGDDLGWLGYFIGKSKYLKYLCIDSWGEGENIEAFMEGINRNQSIASFEIFTDEGVSFRNLRPFFRNNNNLARVELNFEVGLECAQSIAFALGEGQCQSLTYLRLDDCNLCEEGFAEIATALRTYPQLEELHLERNNIGLMGCIALRDMMRGWGASNLKTLELGGNVIGDQGLQELVAGIADSALEELCLSNTLITAAGLRSLSTYFQSESCCLKILYLYGVNLGDEGAVALADALMGNTSLTSLRFIPDDSGITDVGWAAFSKLLCNPASIESTYHSNHKIKMIGEYEMLSAPLNIRQYLELNERPHPAILKILESHPDLEMEPFFQWKLKLLPVVINWLKSARSRLENYLGAYVQRQSLPSRELSALYKFVRGMPSLTVMSYWQQFVMNAQAKRLRIDDEFRRLEDERRRLYYDEEAAWLRLGGRPRSVGSSTVVSGSKRRRHW
eukprot:scaffold12235_cov78-Skeletonema_dohrnii-CCMP3373.AAC.3